jgi:hypothetical protein
MNFRFYKAEIDGDETEDGRLTVFIGIIPVRIKNRKIKKHSCR